MNPNGGYFLTRTLDRPDFMSAHLIPDRLISMSDCICDFVPNLWALQWAEIDSQDRIDEASRFGIPPEMVPAIVSWTTAQLEEGTVGFPCLFYRLDDARSFASRFVDLPDLRLVGISLHADLVDAFLEKEKPEDEQGEPGIYTAIARQQAGETGGVDLGWEPLCYEFGGFHSWLCNSLEVEVAESLHLQPGPTGFFDSDDDALAATTYCGRDEVGAEPGFWAPWLVTEYPLMPFVSDS